MEQARPVTSHRFLRALVDAGVITEEDKVRRVVIDAKMDAVVVMHVERVGDTRLLDVVPTLDGVRITSAEVSE